MIDARMYGSSMRSMSVGSGKYLTGCAPPCRCTFACHIRVYDTLGARGDDVHVKLAAETAPAQSPCGAAREIRNGIRSLRATDDSGVERQRGVVELQLLQRCCAGFRNPPSLWDRRRQTPSASPPGNPSMASSHGLATWVIVSPTFTSREVLMPEMIYPTLPAESFLAWRQVKFEHSYFIGMIFLAGSHKFHEVVFP